MRPRVDKFQVIVSLWKKIENRKKKERSLSYSYLGLWGSFNPIHIISDTGPADLSFSHVYIYFLIIWVIFLFSDGWWFVIFLWHYKVTYSCLSLCGFVFFLQMGILMELQLSSRVFCEFELKFWYGEVEDTYTKGKSFFPLFLDDWFVCMLVSIMLIMVGQL